MSNQNNFHHEEKENGIHEIKASSESSVELRGRSLLFINSGSERKKFIFQKARRLGITIVLLNKEKNWAARYADHFLQADTYNHEECIAKINEFLKEHKLDGAVTFWEDDVPLHAKICDTFGFSGNAYKTALRCRNKYRMREILVRNHIASPKFRLLTRVNFKEAMEFVGFPSVLKPVWGAMSQFVMRVENMEDAERAFDYIRANLTAQFDPIYTYGKELMAEEYLDGQEVDADLLVQNGEIKFSSITDNFPTDEPFFVETGDTLPSNLPARLQEQILDVAYRTVKALGITDSAVHLEARITSRGPRVIEVNARMGGDYIADWIKTVWDVDMVEEIFKIALGLPVIIQKRSLPKSYLYGQYFIPSSSGVITGISGIEEVEHSADIHDLTLHKKVGDAILVPPEGFDTIGWIVGKGASYLEAEQNTKREMGRIRISIAKYDPSSAIGKTWRRNRVSAASFVRKHILQTARIEKIRGLDPITLKPLHIGVLCNRFEAGSDEESLVEQDLMSVGRNIQKALETKGHTVTFFDMNETPLPFSKISEANADIVFNVCERLNESSLLEPHAAALLDVLEIPYTGSSPFTLALAIDKIKTKKLFEYHDIPTPKFDYVFSVDEEIDDALRFPLIVKPANTDNSIGITNESVVTTQQALKERIRYVIETQKRPALIEEYIEGDEIDVSIIGNDERIQVLPLRRAIFDDLPPGVWHIYPFDAKWKDKTVYDKIKAEWSPPYPPQLTKLISEIAIDVYNILDGHDYGRVEMRIDKSGNPYVLELNPNPSINRGDAVPHAAELIGMPYEDFIEQIVKFAVARYRKRPPYYHLQSFVPAL